jgi:hypothetical protein
MSNQGANKPGLKTTKKLQQILFLNGVFRRVDTCCSNMKRKNIVVNFLFRKIAFLMRIFLLALSPITYLVRKPIYSVDSYVNDKIDNWTESCLKISKPTEQVNFKPKRIIKCSLLLISILLKTYFFQR